MVEFSHQVNFFSLKFDINPACSNFSILHIIYDDLYFQIYENISIVLFILKDTLSVLKFSNIFNIHCGNSGRAISDTLYFYSETNQNGLIWC